MSWMHGKKASNLVRSVRHQRYLLDSEGLSNKVLEPLAHEVPNYYDARC